MQRTAVAIALVSILGLAACQKTGENEFEVQKPVVGTQTDTVRTPDVDVTTQKETVTVPNVDVRKDTATVKVPKVEVKKP